jgi:hypothetical protein
MTKRLRSVWTGRLEGASSASEHNGGRSGCCYGRDLQTGTGTITGNEEIMTRRGIGSAVRKGAQRSFIRRARKRGSR